MNDTTESWRIESDRSEGDRRPRRTQLFTLRLWAEDLDGEHTEWRGELHHVTSGELRYFRDWSTLVSILLAMLPDAEGKQLQE